MSILFEAHCLATEKGSLCSALGEAGQSRAQLALAGGAGLPCDRMRLLDRYLLRELLVPLGFCLGGFLIFWISFDVFSELDEFQKRHLLFADVVEYYVLKTPSLLGVVLPVALLLASLYALTNHARHHELTAMRAAGVSLWRLCLPYLVVGVGASLFLFAVNEVWMPDSLERAERVLQRRLSADPDGAAGDWVAKLYFKNTRDDRTWNIDAYNVKTAEMRTLQVDWKLPDGTLRQMFAERAARTNGTWTFYNVQELIYPPITGALPLRSQTNEQVIAEFSETPEQIKSEIRISNLDDLSAAKKPRVPLVEIFAYKRLHPRLDPRMRAKVDTQLHGRLAEAWTCLVVVLIAIPFGTPSGRRSVFFGVAGSIFICFAYYVLMRLGLVLGIGGYLPPWLAAWLPNLLFGGAGVLLTSRVR